jgi:hypothetical protein
MRAFKKKSTNYVFKSSCPKQNITLTEIDKEIEKNFKHLLENKNLNQEEQEKCTNLKNLIIRKTSFQLLQTYQAGYGLYINIKEKRPKEAEKELLEIFKKNINYNDAENKYKRLLNQFNREEKNYINLGNFTFTTDTYFEKQMALQSSTMCENLINTLFTNQSIYNEFTYADYQTAQRTQIIKLLKKYNETKNTKHITVQTLCYLPNIHLVEYIKKNILDLTEKYKSLLKK